MRRAWSGWVAWSLATLVAVLVVLTAVLDEVTPNAAGTEDGGRADIVLVFGFLAFAAVGALVASRQPRNAVGWLFIAVPLFAFTAAFSEQYAFRATALERGALPAGSLFLWFYVWTWFGALCAIAGIVLLFPDGRPPTRRWRPLVRLCAVVWPAALVGVALHEGAVDESDPRWPDNPLGVIDFEGQLVVVQWAAIALVLFTIVGCIASVVFRWRRSRGVERQQLKWMLLAVGVLVAHIVLSETVGAKLGLPDVVVNIGFGISIAAFPVAAGIAMLRYRLYDIDLVIRKTLVYGSITILLAFAYLGLVVAGQELLAAYAGGSNLAIAASTLVVAALFLPVRTRVQHVVDRRFYRRRYDAQRTLERFGARLREQVEIDALATDLRGVVGETVQPAHSSVWLRRAAS